MCDAPPDFILESIQRGRVSPRRREEWLLKLGAIVVSHHEQFRRDLAQFVELIDSCVEVISEVASAGEAVVQVAALRPEIVLIDLNLRHENVLELTELIHFQWPSTSIVLLGNEPVSDYRHLALQAGALEYVDLLEVGTQLAAAMQLLAHPDHCDGNDSVTAPAASGASVVSLRSRLRTAATGPKHGPFTAWQYVFVALGITLSFAILTTQFGVQTEQDDVVLLGALLVCVAVMEARQFSRARRIAAELPHQRWRGGGNGSR